MTEEEKKAIGRFNWINYLIKEFGKEVTLISSDSKHIEILLNLIEKLQKENLLLSAKENMSAYFEFKRNYISKDKIREKIKELEEYIVKIEEETCGRCITIGEDMCIRYLKELLEEN